ncbi:hypothetical protein GUJ93_ZPchr0006g44708 [Zizania palustris]|uniref:F-box domain-containing protein n=1 Tax=Zizania palustris TaxID=103762 RepID=A0A8J5W3D9_ZIZPA|nr:hypothetical protein GUJ93_ZPchr0006g44708 [Zizania palustris]
MFAFKYEYGLPIHVCLPQKLLFATISRTTARVAVVSRIFHTIADSDDVWAGFLPRDLPPLADGEIPPGFLPRISSSASLPAPSSSKTSSWCSMWLDRESGSKCYMLSARALHIVWGDTPEYWDWIALTDSRFAEAAELKTVCWLKIDGNIDTKMLSPNSTYAAYMVFKIARVSYGLASVSLGGRESRRKVCVQSNDNEDVHEENVTVPRRRADGWMELEMGEFFNEKGEDGEACFSAWWRSREAIGREVLLCRALRSGLRNLSDELLGLRRVLE